MNINKLKERLAAMVAKSKDKAATEGEAASAMHMAAKLMLKYGVTLADLESADEPAVRRYDFDGNGGKAVLHEVDSMLGNALANYCDVRIWRSGGVVTFMGLDADIELASFHRTLFKETMDFEYQIYKRFVHEGPLKGARYSFMATVTARLTERMKEAKATTAHFNRDTGALITRKSALIERKLVDDKINLGGSRRSKGTAHWNATAAAVGRTVGDRMEFGRSTGSNGHRGLLK